MKINFVHHNDLSNAVIAVISEIFIKEHDIISPYDFQKYIHSVVGCKAIVEYIKTLHYNVNYWELPPYQIIENDKCKTIYIGFGFEFDENDPSIIQLLLTK